MIDIISSALAAAALAPAAMPLQDSPAVHAEEHVHSGSPSPSGTSFRPRVSFITDFRWNALNSDRSADEDAFEKEGELELAADIDPFLDVEAHLSFSQEDGEGVAEFEQGFARYTDRKGFSAKLGKIAAAIGKVQQIHGYKLDWLDYPFFVQDTLGEEGLRAGGASVSYRLPGHRLHEFTVEALEAPREGLFAFANGRSPVFVGRYRTSFDLSRDASAQLGLSYANGPGAPGNRRSDVLGADFTYNFQPAGHGRPLSLETEAFWAKNGGLSIGRKFGAFAALTYEFKPRWFATAKVDYSESPNSTDIRRAFSLGATFEVNEFHHWRVEWQHVTSNFASPQNLLNIQFLIHIGDHHDHED